MNKIAVTIKRCMITVTFLATLFMGLSGMAIAATTDNIPGLPMPPAPFDGNLVHTYTEWNRHTVYSVDLSAGQTIQATVTLKSLVDIPGGPPNPPNLPGTKFVELLLYAPGTPTVNGDPDYLRISNDFGILTYTATVSGTYYMDIYNNLSNGTYTVACNLSPVFSAPVAVFRFYKPSQGFHFYTASEAEKNSLLGDAYAMSVYTYEGPRFNTSATRTENSSPVYRFYNFLQGVHFYTVNWNEAANVINTAGWTFRYEGIAYYAFTSNNGSRQPLYRFYNFLAGAHFYTTSSIEAEYLKGPGGNWTYRDEGIAFYLPL